MLFDNGHFLLYHIAQLLTVVGVAERVVDDGFSRVASFGEGIVSLCTDSNLAEDFFILFDDSENLFVCVGIVNLGKHSIVFALE